MKVTYARLVNLGNFENERFELEDEVWENESFSEAFERVRKWVEEAAQEAAAARQKAEEEARELRRREREERKRQEASEDIAF